VYVNSKRAGIAAPITQARVVNYKRGVQGCTDDTVKTRAEFRDNYMSLHLYAQLHVVTLCDAMRLQRLLGAEGARSSRAAPARLLSSGRPSTGVSCA
jgi:hypothetical protein